MTNEAITEAAARAKVAAHNGNDLDEAYWTRRVEILSDQQEARRAAQEQAHA
jgi:hypothetical protein